MEKKEGEEFLLLASVKEREPSRGGTCWLEAQERGRKQEIGTQTRKKTSEKGRAWQGRRTEEDSRRGFPMGGKSENGLFHRSLLQKRKGKIDRFLFSGYLRGVYDVHTRERTLTALQKKPLLLFLFRLKRLSSSCSFPRREAKGSRFCVVPFVFHISLLKKRSFFFL